MTLPLRSPFPVLTLIGAMAFGLSSSGEVLVVDRGHPSADDGNPGREDAPLLTIAAAVERMNPGDTVVVKDGIYRESVRREDMGHRNAHPRMTLKAFPGHRPVIRGSDELQARFAPVRVALRAPGEDSVREEHDPDEWRRRLGIDGPMEAQIPPAADPADGLDHAAAPFVGIYACALEHNPQMVFVDGRRLDQIGLQGSPERAETGGGGRYKRQWDGRDMSDLRPGSFFYDENRQRLYIWLEDGEDPSTRLIEVGARAVGIRLFGTWTLSGFDVEHFLDDRGPGHMAVFMMGVGPILEDCRIRNNDFFGVILAGEDGVMRNNEVAYNGVCGLSSSVGFRMLVEENTFRNNGWRGDLLAAHHGNKIVRWQDSQFLRNRFVDETMGLWLDINVNNVLIAENVFERCEGGVYFEISRWGVIANNVFIDCNRGIWSYSSDVLIAHNVLDGCAQGIVVTGNARRCEFEASEEPDRHFALMAVRNNLIVNNLVLDSTAAYVGLSPYSVFHFAHDSDYNAFAWTLPYGCLFGNHIKFMDGWNTYCGRLSIWRQARRFDEHSVMADPKMADALRDDREAWHPSARDVVGDPLIVNRAGGDYRLRADSPLRGRGISIPGELESFYRPAVGREVQSRPWAVTETERAGDGVERLTASRRSFYRMQPLPRPGRLVDLDEQGPADPGLNEDWMRRGAYPVFRSDRDADTVQDDVWILYPENRLSDGRFERDVSEQDEIGSWHVARGNPVVRNLVAMAEPQGTGEDHLVAQRIGIIRPDTEYLLWANMKVDGLREETVTWGAVGLAAGPEMTPIHWDETRTEGRRTRHWNTASVHYRSGPNSGADPHVGQSLYVVLRARAEGPPSGNRQSAGRVLWDHVHLLSGEQGND